jgi:hypothetical protein
MLLFPGVACSGNVGLVGYSKVYFKVWKPVSVPCTDANVHTVLDAVCARFAVGRFARELLKQMVTKCKTKAPFAHASSVLGMKSACPAANCGSAAELLP